MGKDKKDLSNIENKLKNYFRKEALLLAKNKKLTTITKNMESLAEQIKTNNFSIPLESSSPSWGDKVQTSPSGTGYAERTLYNIVSRAEIELSKLADDKYATESEIRQIEIDCATLETNITLLDEESLKLIKMKYGEGRTDLYISDELNLERSSISKKKNKILEYIATWEKWVI